MSAGRFESTKYELNGGQVAAIRVQPETVLATFGGTANAAPAGAIDFPVAAKVTKGNREYGLGARSVSAVWTGTVPTGYDNRGTLNITILTEALFNTIGVGTVGVYLNEPIRVIGVKGEQRR